MSYIAEPSSVYYTRIIICTTGVSNYVKTMMIWKFYTFAASVCDMFNISVSKVIHCNSPSWNKSSGVMDLHKTIENCLKLADTENMKSIALPSVGSGK